MIHHAEILNAIITLFCNRIAIHVGIQFYASRSYKRQSASHMRLSYIRSPVKITAAHFGFATSSVAQPAAAARPKKRRATPRERKGAPNTFTYHLISTGVQRDGGGSKPLQRKQLKFNFVTGQSTVCPPYSGHTSNHGRAHRRACNLNIVATVTFSVFLHRGRRARSRCSMHGCPFVPVTLPFSFPLLLSISMCLSVHHLRPSRFHHSVSVSRPFPLAVCVPGNWV